MLNQQSWAPGQWWPFLPVSCHNLGTTKQSEGEAQVRGGYLVTLSPKSWIRIPAKHRQFNTSFPISFLSALSWLRSPMGTLLSCSSPDLNQLSFQMEISTDWLVNADFLKIFQDYIKADDLGIEDQKESHSQSLPWFPGSNVIKHRE